MVKHEDILEAERRIAEALATGKKRLDLSGLVGVTSLRELGSDFISSRTITALDISGTQIDELTHISGMDWLDELFLDQTPIHDISPIAGMQQLGWLDLSGTKITELSLTAGLTGIRALFFNNTPVADITPIAELKQLDTIGLSNTQVVNLSPVANMKWIRSLNLGSTLITDLTPIAGMKSITWLSLHYNQINDFSALTNLENLKSLILAYTNFEDIDILPKTAIFEELNFAGSKVFDLRPVLDLTFAGSSNKDTLRVTDTPATLADPRIAEIDALEDHNARVATLLDYLKDWVPTIPPNAEGARGYTYHGDGPIASKDASPTNDDTDQKDLQNDLQRKVSDLSDAIGGSNELGRLSASVNHYARQINRPLSELRLKTLYSAANSLRVAYEAHAQAVEQTRDMECLPPQTAAALQDVVETHALFFMGFPEGVTIHQTMMSGLTGERQPDVAQLASELVDALRGQDDVMTPDDQAALSDDAIAATGQGPSAEIGERSLIGSLGNAIGAVGRFVWAHKGKFSAGTTYTVLKWMVAKEAAISQFLVAYQGPYSAWFKAMIEIIKPWV